MRRRQVGLTGGLLLLLACCGCPTPAPSNSGSGGIPFLDTSPNSTFETATTVPLPNSGELQFKGEVDSPADLDLYKLGTLDPGDEVLVDVEALSTGLDPVAAVFDSHQNLQAYNDDRTPDSSNLNPLIDFVVRGPTDTYFLGISGFSGSSATGTYQVTLQITRGVGVPSPHEQIVFLNWAGGQHISVPNVGTFNLPPFDVSQLGPYPSARTGEMKARVQQIIAQRYTGYDLVLRNSDDNPVPSEPHSTVYFGGLHPQAFAISEQVDAYNADPSDSTIVFTESFQDAFIVTPTFDQMATALGNTVAHEVGHLLGLVHTADCDDLMDSSCANERLLATQEFKTGKLDATVFPLGLQDAQELLDWILGLVGLQP